MLNQNAINTEDFSFFSYLYIFLLKWDHNVGNGVFWLELHISECKYWVWVDEVSNDIVLFDKLASSIPDYC